MNKLLSKANSDEVIGVNTSVIDILEKSAYSNENFILLKNLLVTNNNELIAAHNRKKKNENSDAVTELKILREKSYSSFIYTIKGLFLRADVNLSDNARIVREILLRHGKGFKRSSYTEQTAKMQSIFNELEQPALKALLALIGITLSYDELKLSNTAFLDMLSKRSIDDGMQKVFEDSTSAKKKAIGILNQLINFLNLSAIIDKSTTLNDLINSLSGVINKANINIRSRNSQNNGSDEVED